MFTYAKKKEKRIFFKNKRYTIVFYSTNLYVCHIMGGHILLDNLSSFSMATVLANDDGKFCYRWPIPEIKTKLKH